MGQSLSGNIDIREVRQHVQAYYSRIGKIWKDKAAPELVDTSDLPKIIIRLGSKRRLTRQRALQALGDIGPDAQPAIPAILRAWQMAPDDESPYFVRTLNRIGPAASSDTAALSNAVECSRKPIRLYALKALSGMGMAGRSAVSKVLEATQASDGEVQAAAYDAVARVADLANLETVRILLRGLRAPDPRARKAAAVGLRRCGTVAHNLALHPLLECMGDTDPGVTAEVDAALLALGPATEEDLPILEKILEGSAVNPCVTAAGMAGQMGTLARPLVAKLTKLAETENPLVRRAAVEALRNLGGEARPALPVLLRATKDREAAVRAGAVSAVINLGGGEGVYPALLHCLGDAQPEVRALAQVGLPKLATPTSADAAGIGAFLTSENPLVRTQAAEAIGRLGPAAKGAVPHLVTALKDRDFRVRTGAARALAGIGPEARAAAPTIIEVLNDTPPDTVALPLEAVGLPRPKEVAPKDRLPESLPLSTVWIVASRPGLGISYSSGWVVDPVNRLVVTDYPISELGNTHVAFFPEQQAGVIQTKPGWYLNNLRQAGIRGKVVASKPMVDLSLIQLARLPASAEGIRLAETSAIPGQNVHSVGAVDVDVDSDIGTLWRYAFAKVKGVFPQSLTAGYGRFRRPIIAQMLVTDTILNSGAAGAPIVNDAGELVGMSSVYSTRGSLTTYGIDVGVIRAFLEQVTREKGLKIQWAAARNLSSSATPGNASGGGLPIEYKTALLLALEKVGGEDITSLTMAVRSGLKDKDPQVKARAAALAGSLGEKAKPVVADLIYLTRDKDAGTAAEDALAKMGHSVVPVLVKYLEEKDRRLTVGIARTLIKIGPPAPGAVTALRWSRMAFPRDTEVKEAVAEAIRVLEIK